MCMLWRISSVDFFSNGATLQGTIWLTKPISCQHLNLTRYGMSVCVFSNNSNTIASYESSVVANHGTWTSNLIAYQPIFLSQMKQKGLPLDETLKQLVLSHENRTLNIEHNYTQYGHNSVTLSMNLGAIGYPTTYFVSFYIDTSDGIYDRSPMYPVPPHLNRIEVGWPPSPYHMIGGDDDAFIPIHVNSTDIEPGKLYLSADHITSQNGIDVGALTRLILIYLSPVL